MTVRRAPRPRAPLGPRPVLNGMFPNSHCPVLYSTHRHLVCRGYSALWSSLPPFLSPFHPVRLPFPRHLFLEPPPVSTCPPVIPAPLPNRRDWQLPLWAWASDEGASRITACPRRLPCPSSSHPHTRASSNATSVLLRVAAGRHSMHRVFASRYAIGGLFVHGPLRSRASSGRRFLVAGAGVSQGLTRTRMMRSATIGNCYK